MKDSCVYGFKVVANNPIDIIRTLPRCDGFYAIDSAEHSSMRVYFNSEDNAAKAQDKSRRAGFKTQSIFKYFPEINGRMTLIQD